MSEHSAPEGPGRQEVELDPDDIAKSLEDAPEEFRGTIRRGFQSILTLDAETVVKALREISRDVSKRPDLREFSSLLSLPSEEARAVGSALVIFVLTAGKVPVPKLIQGLTVAGLVSATDAAKLEQAVGVPFQREQGEIKRQVAEQEIASRVLQNVTDISWTVDLRARYSEGQLAMLAPVAIVGFITDLDEKLIFQLSAEQLERTLKTFQRIKERMDDLRSRAKALVP